MIPGVGETLRINGSARLSTDPELCESFRHAGQAPKVVLVVNVQAVYFQCSRAVVRSDLWNPGAHVERASLPTPGKILSDASAGKIDGGVYDRELPGRVKATLY